MAKLTNGAKAAPRRPDFAARARDVMATQAERGGLRAAEVARLHADLAQLTALQRLVARRSNY